MYAPKHGSASASGDDSPTYEANLASGQSAGSISEKCNKVAVGNYPLI